MAGVGLSAFKKATAREGTGGEVQEGLSEEVAFQWTPERSKGRNYDNTRGEQYSRQRSSKAKAMSQRVVGPLQRIGEASLPWPEG